MTSTPNSMALLLATLLLQGFLINAYPNPEPSLDQRSSGTAAVPFDLLPRAQPQTQMDAEEAAKGGTVIKSGTDNVASAESGGEGESKVGLGDPIFGPSWDSCKNNPIYVDVEFVGPVTYNLVRGNAHSISNTMCPPGSVGHSYSVGITWNMNAQLGPDLKGAVLGSSKVIKNYLDKLAGRLGVSWSETTVQSSSYTAQDLPTSTHPFKLVYYPTILVAKGKIKIVRYVTPGKDYFVCETSYKDQLDLHVPAVEGDDCVNKKTSCGIADATFDHCEFVGAYAKWLCPKRNLGAFPQEGYLCPTSFYPPQYLDHGRIRG